MNRIELRDCISTSILNMFSYFIVGLCETSLLSSGMSEVSSTWGTRFEIKPTVAPTGKEVPVLPFELSSKDWP